MAVKETGGVTIANKAVWPKNMAAAGTKIRVFIGTEPKTEIARKVLECSIIRRTDADVIFTPMIGLNWEYPTDEIVVGTGFSLRRWMIAAECGFHGRAIYIDADQIVFDDIYNLWTMPEQRPCQGSSIWCTYQPDKFNNKAWPQSSVMVIDCAAAYGEWGWHIGRIIEHLKHPPAGTTPQQHYADFMHMVAPKDGRRQWWTRAQPVPIPTEWNHLNIYEPNKTRLLHYTKEPEQPWYKPDHPFAAMWQQELQVAINMRMVTHEDLTEAIARFGLKEDWRKTNGLHPFYKKYAADAHKRKITKTS